MSKKVVASGQITLVDLNDSRPMSLVLKANRSTTQVYNVNSGAYEPDYSKEPIIITPTLFFGNEDTSHKIGTEINYKINGNIVAASVDGNIPEDADGYYQIAEKLYITQNMGKGVFAQDNILLIEAYIQEAKITDELTGLSNGYLAATVDLAKLDTGLDGADGAAARGITISGEQVFISSDGKTYLPEKITLAANCMGDLTVGKWYYKSSDNWVVIENSQDKTSLEILNSASYFQNNVATIKVVSKESEGYYDIMSIYKVSNGKDGENGDAGESPFLVYITNENISFAADENGKVIGKTVVSYVKAQAGLEEVVPVINTNGIKGGISGQLTIQVGTKNENGIPITITALPESLLGGEEPQQGVIEIPITSPVTTILSINWSKINSGKKGEDGRDSFGSHIEFLEGKNVFSEENKNDKITLRAHFTEGGLLVANDITYQWSGSPTSIPNNVNRTSQTLEVTSNMITGANTFTCIMTNKDGVARASSVSITDYSDPYICSIESSYGTEFVNAQGETELTCTVFKGAEGQVDTQGTKYQYSWEKFNINNNGARVKDSAWSANSKTTPSISASEIDDRAVFVCKVSYNNTLIGLAELWLYDRLDSATYIYYSANANGSSPSITPDSNTKYIGIYSGPAFATQPATPPAGTKWSQYKGDKGDKGDKGETGSGYKIVYMQSLPEMTSVQWKNLQENSTTKVWTTNKANAHIQVGDTAQISGKATDAKDASGQNVTVVLVGQVTAINGSSSITIATSSVQIGGSVGKDGENGQMLYAICYDTGEKRDKTANLQSGSLTLNAGTIVAVKFVAVNTADEPRINIGSSGLFPIYLGATPLTSKNALWKENAIINLVYNTINIGGEDKGCWEIVNGSELEYIKIFDEEIKSLDGEIKLRVKTEIYDENNKKVQDKISALEIKEDSISTKVGTLDRDVSTWVQTRDSFNWSFPSEAIVSQEEQFYSHTSPTSLPPADAQWTSTQPVWTEGKYIWMRTKVTYGGTGGSKYLPSENGVCITGNTGANFIKLQTDIRTVEYSTWMNYMARDSITWDRCKNTDVKVGDTGSLAGKIADRGNVDCVFIGTITEVGALSNGERGITMIPNNFIAGINGRLFYGTCSTAAGTAEKVVSLVGGEDFQLMAGSTVSIKFTNANSASSPKLNVVGLGAKNIRIYGQNLTDPAYYWTAGATVSFTYDGTYWNFAEGSTLAPNFMSFVENQGLYIGNKTGGTWKGYRTLIKNDSFNILNSSGATVASYGANTIDLGYRNTNATIRLCGRLVNNEDVYALTMSYGALNSNYGTVGFSGSISQIVSTGTLALDAPGSIGLFTRGTDYKCYIKIGPQSTGGTIKSIDLIVDQTAGNKGLSSLAINHADIKLTSNKTYISAALDVGGVADFSGVVNAKNTLNVTGISNLIGGAAIGGDLTGANNKALSLKSDLTSTGSITLTAGGISSKGSITTDGAITVKGGASITGNLVMDTNSIIYGNILASSSGQLNLVAAKEIVFNAYNKGQRFCITGECIRPIGNKSYNLGEDGNRWKDIYLKNGANTFSDKKVKKDIENIDEKYQSLFNKLKPVSYRFNFKESDRKHLGFISQDVEQSMLEVGLTDLDFGGFCKDAKMEEIEIKNEELNTIDIIKQQKTDENGEPIYSYSLRYQEFIALNTKMIQLNQQRIETLEEEIKQLKLQLSKFENSSNL